MSVYRRPNRLGSLMLNSFVIDGRRGGGLYFLSPPMAVPEPIEIPRPDARLDRVQDLIADVSPSSPSEDSRTSDSSSSSSGSGDETPDPVQDTPDAAMAPVDEVESMPTAPSPVKWRFKEFMLTTHVAADASVPMDSVSMPDPDPELAFPVVDPRLYDDLSWLPDVSAMAAVSKVVASAADTQGDAPFLVPHECPNPQTCSKDELMNCVLYHVESEIFMQQYMTGTALRSLQPDMCQFIRAQLQRLEKETRDNLVAIDKYSGQDSNRVVGTPVPASSSSSQAASTPVVSFQPIAAPQSSGAGPGPMDMEHGSDGSLSFTILSKTQGEQFKTRTGRGVRIPKKMRVMIPGPVDKNRHKRKRQPHVETKWDKVPYKSKGKGKGKAKSKDDKEEKDEMAEDLEPESDTSESDKEEQEEKETAKPTDEADPDDEQPEENEKPPIKKRRKRHYRHAG